MSSEKSRGQSPRYKAARSVHTWWKASDEDVSAFYNEACVCSTVRGSYFMACGFDGGYFGIQELVDGRRRVLFSVWDVSSEMNQGRDDPTRISKEDRVQILYQAPDVHVQRFGGEGTGAQCFDDAIGWDTGVRVSFLVHTKRFSDGCTFYAAYVRRDPAAVWKHLASYKVACGKPFRGFYSFIEDFRRDGTSVEEERRAAFGPAWVLCRDGGWQPAVESCFTASGASWERPDNIDCCGGPSAGTRILATGGNSLCGLDKLKSAVRLDPGSDGQPVDTPCPNFPDIADCGICDVADTRHPLCPLCRGGLGNGCGPLCGGVICEPSQCSYVGNAARCVWPRADVCDDSLDRTRPLFCHHHTSSGQKCPLCGRKVAGLGPYCYGNGECCGYRQCQRMSPLPSGGRCPWPCHQGGKCSYHM
eukprot:TRINITY_DN51300_c0_g1_i1.p1 TRINITY_DN51300_c0_g1~~TRINITY_DN51300_c0_g1_i1.p1  ORF type:complete len:459 (-),score=47.22 TRINITY_DN51300_c0_g1_i1:77-1327(-)